MHVHVCMCICLTEEEHKVGRKWRCIPLSRVLFSADSEGVGLGWGLVVCSLISSRCCLCAGLYTYSRERLGHLGVGGGSVGRQVAGHGACGVGGDGPFARFLPSVGRVQGPS